MKADGATLALLSSAGKAKSTINTMMYGNLAINIAMYGLIYLKFFIRSASLQMLWGMINVMQIIVQMPLLNISFP